MYPDVPLDVTINLYSFLWVQSFMEWSQPVGLLYIAYSNFKNVKT